MRMDTESQFGVYKPSFRRRAALAVAHRLPAWLAPLTKVLRRPIKYGAVQPVDLKIWGYRLRLMSRGNISEQKLYTAPQLFDREELAAIGRILKPGGSFVDIGANAGIYSLHAHRCLNGKGRILAIEPDPEMRRRLEFNISVNDISIAKIFPIALSDKKGKARFAVNVEQRGTNHILPESDLGGGEVIEVQQTTLLDLLQEEGIGHVDVLKIDIEGHEKTVLEPFFADAPKHLLPRLIICEAHPSSVADMRNFFHSNNYRIEMQTKLNLVCTHVD